MKILLVHNRYQQYGGEDATFETEKMLLQDNGEEVRTLIFDNNEIKGLKQKIKTGFQMIYNSNSERLMDVTINEFKPDVIHIHNFFYVASPSVFFSAHRHKIPVIVTLQNYRLICSGGFLMRDSQPCELCVEKVFPLSGIRYGCHRNSRMGTAHLTMYTGIHKLWNTWNSKVTRYIAVTEFGRNKYIHSSLKLAPEKIVVKASSVAGADPSDFQARQRNFLFVGRLSKEKGIDVLLRAFAHTDLHLEIIGDGPLRPLVEQYTSEHQNITYSGYRDKAYIISQLRACAAMIFPSVWYECLPVTILEAFSTGTPVIISNVGNLNEIVTDQYNGLHFQANDAQHLQNIVQHFNTNREIYKSLYSNARKTFLEKYTHEVNYSNLMTIYIRAIQDSLQDN